MAGQQGSRRPGWSPTCDHPRVCLRLLRLHRQRSCVHHDAPVNDLHLQVQVAVQGGWGGVGLSIGWRVRTRRPGFSCMPRLRVAPTEAATPAHPNTEAHADTTSDTHNHTHILKSNTDTPEGSDRVLHPCHPGPSIRRYELRTTETQAKHDEGSRVHNRRRHERPIDCAHEPAPPPVVVVLLMSQPSTRLLNLPAFPPWPLQNGHHARSAASVSPVSQSRQQQYQQQQRQEQ